MALRSRRRNRRKVAQTDLDMTIFMNLLMVLVPFLLLTAVFSRINILELTLPSSAGGTAAAEPKFRLEVIVRRIGLELTNGKVLIAAIPNQNGAYDLATLSQMVVALKRDYPDSNAASVLLEPDIAYDNLIQVMDAVRSAEVPADRAIAPPPGGDATAAMPAPPGATAVTLAANGDSAPNGTSGASGTSAAPVAGLTPAAGDALAAGAAPASVRVALFTDISVGDAPQ